MATPLERRLLQAQLVKDGFVTGINKWPARVTYYKPDGEALPNLPADPPHMQKYLDRGFTLKPPVVAAPPKPVEASLPVAAAVQEEGIQLKPKRKMGRPRKVRAVRQARKE